MRIVRAQHFLWRSGSKWVVEPAAWGAPLDWSSYALSWQWMVYLDGDHTCDMGGRSAQLELVLNFGSGPLVHDGPLES